MPRVTSPRLNRFCMIPRQATGHATSSTAHSTRWLLVAAALAVALASCATVRVSGAPTTQSDAVASDPARAAHWHFDAGNRPPAERDGYRPPVKLAVLLPLSGALSTAAAPVRDGLLAGYYGEQRRRPELVFYDTTGTPAGAVAAYAKAVSDGADQVLGPLGRDEVAAVFQDGQVTVPVIALNRGVATPPANNASFSLAPEDEGIAAAEYLLSRNARRVLVLSNGDDGARRSVNAFRERLQAREGSIVDTIAVVGDKPADLTTAFLASAQKEGGVDAVFFAVKSAQARVVAPQLYAAGLGGKPRVATSQLASAGTKPEQNIGLDGIAFPTESWTAGGMRALPPAAGVGAQLPTARGPAAKLFAFGYDAWQLTAYLEHLANSGSASLQGATGVLSIDPTGNVLRLPAWSTYSGGFMVPLTTGSGG